MPVAIDSDHRRLCEPLQHRLAVAAQPERRIDNDGARMGNRRGQQIQAAVEQNRNVTWRERLRRVGHDRPIAKTVVNSRAMSPASARDNIAERIMTRSWSRRPCRTRRTRGSPVSPRSARIVAMR